MVRMPTGTRGTQTRKSNLTEDPQHRSTYLNKIGEKATKGTKWSKTKGGGKHRMAEEKKKCREKFEGTRRV